MNLFRRLFNDRGEEIPDPTPVEVPVSMKRPLTIQEQIRKLVVDESFRQAMHKRGMETPDEADDFDVGDDYDPSSPYEEDFDPSFKFIGARVGETRGMMVEEKPLTEAHRQAMRDARMRREALKKEKQVEEPKNDK